MSDSSDEEPRSSRTRPPAPAKGDDSDSDEMMSIFGGAEKSRPKSRTSARQVKTTEKFKPTSELRKPSFNIPFLDKVLRDMEKQDNFRRQTEAEMQKMDLEQHESSNIVQHLVDNSTDVVDEALYPEDGEELFTEVPIFETPQLLACDGMGKDLLDLYARDADNFKLWVTKSKLSGANQSREFGRNLFNFALFHSDLFIATEAVIAFEQYCVEYQDKKSWLPTHEDLLVSLLDYGLDVNFLPLRLKSKIKDSRHRGVYAPGSELLVNYGEYGWYPGTISHYRREEGRYGVSSEGGTQYFHRLPDEDFRTPKTHDLADCQGEDIDPSRDCVNRHLVNFLWVLQTCFEKGSLDMEEDDVKAWFILLCKIWICPCVLRCPPHVYKKMKPASRRGCSPPAAVAGAITSLLEHSVAATEWQSVKGKICQVFTGHEITLNVQAKLALMRGVVPQTRRGFDLFSVLSSCMIQAAVLPVDAQIGCRRLKFQELDEMMGTIQVSKGINGRLLLNGQPMEYLHFLMVIKYIQDYLEDEVDHLGYKDLNRLETRVMLWKKSLSPPESKAYASDAKEAMEELAGDLSSVLMKQKRERAEISLSGGQQRILSSYFVGASLVGVN